MHKLLLGLISKKQEDCPSITEFLSELEKSFFSNSEKEKNFHYSIFNDFRNMIINADDKMDEETKNIKQDADAGDSLSMWKFAQRRSKGIGCKPNESEAWYYYQKAAENNCTDAQIFIKLLKRKNSAIVAKKN